MYKVLLSAIVMGLVVTPVLVKAQESKAAASLPSSATTTTAAAADKAVEVGHKFCPVSREKVGAGMGKVVKKEYKGKIYNLCCNMCIKDFDKNPEKYTKIVDDEVSKEKAKAATN